jgi:hypothetical protein
MRRPRWPTTNNVATNPVTKSNIARHDRTNANIGPDANRNNRQEGCKD